MLWFGVWSTLVVLTLLGAFVLGRRLWRSARAVLAELERASEAMARLEALQEEARERFPPPVPPTADIGAGPEERARFRAIRNDHREAVRRRRTRRLDRAMRHWRDIGAPF